jgi:hypothetical protein
MKCSSLKRNKKAKAPWKGDVERYEFLLKEIPLDETEILEGIRSGKLAYVQLRHFFFDSHALSLQPGRPSK